MKACLLFIGLLLIGTAWSQDVKSVLTKVNETYANKNVSYSTRYELFKGHKSDKVHSSYSGKVVSFNGNVYQKIDNTEFIYTNEFSIKLNADEKSMVLLPVQTAISPELDLDLALKDCSSSELIDKGSFYKIVLRLKPSSSLQCSVINLEVNKTNYSLDQIDIYYSFLQDFSTEISEQDLNQPHMRILFSNVNLNASAEKELFLQNSYFSTNGSTLKPSGNYSSYTISDNR